MQGACISHLERRDGFYSALLSTDTIGRVTAGSTNPRDRSLRPTREGTLQVELVEQRFSLYRPWHAMHRLSVTQRNRLTSVRGLPSAFGAYVYTVILAQQVKTGKENGDVLSHKTSSHLRATDLPHAPCVQEAIPPPHECRGSPCQRLMKSGCCAQATFSAVSSGEKCMYNTHPAGKREEGHAIAVGKNQAMPMP